MLARGFDPANYSVDKVFKTIRHNIDSRGTEQGGLVFLGDSITDWKRLEKYYPDIAAINRGIAGDTAETLYARIGNTVALAPRKVILLIGTNDLAVRAAPDTVVRRIERIIDTLLTVEGIEIILQSIYPVNHDAKRLFSYGMASTRTNENIDYVNGHLQALAQQKGIIFADVARHLKDGQGRLKREYTTDGLHLSVEGYRTVSQYLTTFISI
jgi:lysophospholipase L1-like esterase